MMMMMICWTDWQKYVQPPVYWTNPETGNTLICHIVDFDDHNISPPHEYADKWPWYTALHDDEPGDYGSVFSVVMASNPNTRCIELAAVAGMVCNNREREREQY
jgi:hypothetical protein